MKYKTLHYPHSGIDHTSHSFKALKVMQDLYDQVDDRNPEFNLKDPKLWELWYKFLSMGNAGFILHQP